MTESEHLAEALEALFSSPESMWFVTYPGAVEGLSAAQAANNPGPRLNSIWGVTLHLTVCQRFARAVLCSDAGDMSIYFPEGTWPPVHHPDDESTWEQAKADVLSVNHALAACVASLTDTELGNELTPIGMKAYQYIQGHLAHNSNHLCEIVTTRHLQGLWLEKT